MFNIFEEGFRKACLHII